MSHAADYHDDDWPEITRDDDLAKGLWPQSTLMWLIFGWFFLYIIRPWEVLFPALQTLRIERTYCLTVMAFIAFSGRLRIDTSRQSIALGALFVSMLIASVTGISFEQSRGTMYEFMIHIAMYVAMISAIRKPRDLLCIAAMYITIMAMYLGKSQWEYFVHGRHKYTQGVPRLMGIDITYSHYNAVASSALLTLPIAFMLWTIKDHIWASAAASRRHWIRLVLAAYFALAVSSVLLTNSRGGMLGLLIFAALSCITGKSVLKALIALTIGAVVMLPVAYILLPETQAERFKSLWQGEAGTSAQGSLELRKEAAIDGLRIFAENPVSGVGPGNFKLYRRLRGDASTLEAHNVYIHVLGELGAIGGAAFLAFIGCTWLNFRKIRRLSKNTVTGEGRFLQALALAGTNSLILLAYTGMTGSNFSRFNWYWLAGLGVSGLTICRDGFLYNTPEELD